MSQFEKTLAEDRRLTILKALEAAAQYRVNAFLLRRYCASLGHTVSADCIETDIAWLREQGLVTVEYPEKVSVATLTQRGLDAASGSVSVPGVARPQPGL